MNQNSRALLRVCARGLLFAITVCLALCGALVSYQCSLP